MTRDEAIKELKECQGTGGDIETQHRRADIVLTEFLINLGYQDVVDEWEKVEKWYS